MRPDLGVVAGLVGHDRRVLDLGCGDGELLEHLIREQGCDGLGVERDEEDFHACIARGVPVTLGDIETELRAMEPDSFDCAVLSLTLQATGYPARVLGAMRRVAPRRVVSLPNFGHWRLRLGLALSGRMPSSKSLPYEWYDTPNIHLCTLRDFEALVPELGMRVADRVLLDEDGHAVAGHIAALPNLLAVGAVYALEG